MGESYECATRSVDGSFWITLSDKHMAHGIIDIDHS